MLLDRFRVESDNVSYEAECIRSRYEYNDTEAELSDAGDWTVKPVKARYEFCTDRRLPKLGCEWSFILDEAPVRSRRGRRV